MIIILYKAKYFIKEEKIKYTSTKYANFPKVVLFFTILFLITGCNFDVLVKTDYENEYYMKDELKTKNAQIVEVFESSELQGKAKEDPKYHLGIIHINKSNSYDLSPSYRLDKPIGNFAKNSIIKLIQKETKEEIINPIILFVDTFKITKRMDLNSSKKGLFKCNLRFCYPVTIDSFQMVRVNSEKWIEDSLYSRHIEKTNYSRPSELVEDPFYSKHVEKIIYSSVFECAKSFIESYGKTDKYYIPNIDTVVENFSFKYQIKSGIFTDTVLSDGFALQAQTSSFVLLSDLTPSVSIGRTFLREHLELGIGVGFCIPLLFVACNSDKPGGLFAGPYLRLTPHPSDNSAFFIGFRAYAMKSLAHSCGFTIQPDGDTLEDISPERNYHVFGIDFGKNDKRSKKYRNRHNFISFGIYLIHDLENNKFLPYPNISIGSRF